jgi:hypothetical protein
MEIRSAWGLMKRSLVTRRYETSYGTMGGFKTLTSYDATTGGNVTRQVQRSSNGLGQLVTEYQTNETTVNTSTTPSVGYTYGEMAGGANH